VADAAVARLRPGLKRVKILFLDFRTTDRDVDLSGMKSAHPKRGIISFPHASAAAKLKQQHPGCEPHFFSIRNRIAPTTAFPRRYGLDHRILRSP
jgi:hypothetical protein